MENKTLKEKYSNLYNATRKYPPIQLPSPHTTYKASEFIENARINRFISRFSSGSLEENEKVKKLEKN